MKQKIEKLLNEMPDTEDSEILINYILKLSEEDRNILINANLRDLLPKSFFSGLDKNFKYFCSLIRKDLRDEKDSVEAITAYPGTGKSVLGAIFGAMIDYDYSFKNICFIPTSNEISKKYLGLPMYSNLHIDEASRGMHKQQWFDKVQQTLNILYDTERESHYLCTTLIMPRFQNFTENFRNFRIKYWMWIVERGIVIVYKKDEDKDTKDPWHIDENYKMKQKKWRGKRLFERNISEIIRIEQQTKNYLFYFKFPPIPKKVWSIYQYLKKQSRIEAREKEGENEMESYKDKVNRQKRERWNKIKELKSKGHTHAEIGAVLGTSAETIRRNLREIEAYDKMNNNTPTTYTEKDIINNNLNGNSRFKSIALDEKKEQNVL